METGKLRSCASGAKEASEAKEGPGTIRQFEARAPALMSRLGRADTQMRWETRRRSRSTNRLCQIPVSSTGHVPGEATVCGGEGTDFGFCFCYV